MNRENDFRASGSGHILYDKSSLDERYVKLAFNMNEKIKAQSIAFDFVFNEKKDPVIVEISYGFSAPVYNSCAGYWDEHLNWHEGKFNVYGWMVDNLINDYP